MQALRRHVSKNEISLKALNSTNVARNLRPSVACRIFNEEPKTLSNRLIYSKPLNTRVSVLSRISAAVELQVCGESSQFENLLQKCMHFIMQLQFTMWAI
jgi:hypothetical protein